MRKRERGIANKQGNKRKVKKVLT
jgi:hypothetical protein